MEITVQIKNQRPMAIQLPAKELLISDFLTKNGIKFDLPCGGNRTCKKCKVIARGRLSELSAEEKNYLSYEERAAGFRFACMTKMLGDAEIILEGEKSISIVTDGDLPAFQRNPWGTRYGAAVDIGTTTVALYLVDLTTGEIVSRASCNNPQASFGADVISRIGASINGCKKELSAAIISSLCSLLADTCEKYGIRQSDIDSAVIAGNTAMLYLLTGESPESIAAAPFVSKDLFGRFLDMNALGLTMADGAKGYLPRCIGAYLGGDTTAAMLSSGLNDYGNALLLDLGTNGEMVLKAGSRYFGCSTAAGPAFEGVGLYQGMRAVPGAIDTVKAKDGELAYTVIGESGAAGICGSGMIGCVAALLDLGVVDETGRLIADAPYSKSHWAEIGGFPAVQIGESGVFVTQKDVRSLQLAKSAVCAGITTLLHESGLGLDDLERLLLAGGFGSFLNLENAETIGIIPKGLARVGRATGNSAGMGAYLMLVDRDQITKNDRLAQGVTEIDLSQNAFFQERYIDCMLFE